MRLSVSCDVVKRIAPRAPDSAQAEATFQLGVYFHEAGNETLANQYWEQAEAGNPDSWNYHRQDWSFTPAEAGPNWMKKFQGLDEDYYPALDLPKVSDGE